MRKSVHADAGHHGDAGGPALFCSDRLTDNSGQSARYLGAWTVE